MTVKGRERYLREAFITHHSASESAEEKNPVIIKAEECYMSRIPLVKMEAIKKSLSARDAGSLTSRVNSSVMARLVVLIQAILDPLQGN